MIASATTAATTTTVVASVALATTMAAGAATATALASTVHASSIALGDAASGLRAHVVGDGVVDFSELTVAVGVLTVFIPLAEPFVLEVAALLGLEALVY